MEREGCSRRDFLLATAGTVTGLSLSQATGLREVQAAEDSREVVKGITTRRTIQGEPYELAGKRLVFTNWHYVRPGVDAEWLNPDGRSVRVHGSEGPRGPRFQGDHAYGIRLVAQPAQHFGPLLEPERPWESKGISFGTVIQEDGLYRCWGGCDTSKAGQKPAIRSCYFESKDGLKWERPHLGQVEFGGNRENNLLDYPGGTVFIDPSAPKGERYKCVFTEDISGEEFETYRKQRPEDWEPRALLLFAESNKVSAIKGAVSPDGLRWTKIREPLVVEYSDTQIVAHYDEVLRKYVMYTRWWSVGPRTQRLPPDIRRCWTGVGRRCIGRSESADFRRFPVSRMILEPTPDMRPSDVLYTNCRTAIPGASDHHLMFPALWHMDDDTTTIALLSSHDGEVWHYVPGSPVLDTAAFGQWDGGCIFASPNLVALRDGSFALPYTGYLFPHKYPRGQWKFQAGYALWPRGRLVALEAPDRGEFATISIMPPGRKLRINAVTKRAGSILVQVDGVGGRTLNDVTPIVGDQHWAPVLWKGQDDLGHTEGGPIVLRFRLDRARIFGLDFE